MRIGGEFRGDFAEGEGSEIRQQQEHADEEAKVANAIDDESFLAGIGCGFLLEPEADEQIRRQTHAFPADKHEQGIAGQHQDGHEEEEEIQVAEVAPVAIFFAHVADGINVDQKTDAGDDQQHDQRELVENEAEVDMEQAGVDPVAIGLGVRERQARTTRDHGVQHHAE